MIVRTTAIVLVILLFATPASAQFDQILKRLGISQTRGLSDAKDRLWVKRGLEDRNRKCGSCSQDKLDGYFKNQAIKILMPEKLQTMEKTLRAVGLGHQVDEFILSMNRAAERAAPAAKQIFWDAIGEMTFQDAKKILSGNETAATDYFKAKTTDKLTTAFRPIVDKATNEVGVTRQYKELVGRFQSIPFVKTETVDIDQYVTTKALDGLFYVVAQEEKKIRTDPAARVTDLLKEVFGK